MGHVDVNWEGIPVGVVAGTASRHKDLSVYYTDSSRFPESSLGSTVSLLRQSYEASALGNTLAR